jgi:thiamine monophosphate synthase
MPIDPDIRLIVILDEQYASKIGGNFLELVETMAEELDSGAAFMLRLKHFSASQQHTLLDDLGAIAADHDDRTWLLNASVEVETPEWVSGRHWPSRFLGHDDLPDADSHGFSTHSKREVRHANKEEADWATISPLRKPQSKPDDPRQTLGFNELPEYVDLAGDTALFALGGVRPGDISLLLAAGFAGGAVLGPAHSENIERAVSEVQEYLKASA